MYCRFCGAKINESDKFCSNCGRRTTIGDSVEKNIAQNDSPNTVRSNVTSAASQSGCVCAGKKKKKHALPFIIVAAAVFIAAAIFITVNTISNNPSGEYETDAGNAEKGNDDTDNSNIGSLPTTEAAAMQSDTSKYRFIIDCFDIPREWEWEISENSNDKVVLVLKDTEDSPLCITVTTDTLQYDSDDIFDSYIRDNTPQYLEMRNRKEVDNYSFGEAVYLEIYIQPDGEEPDGEETDGEETGGEETDGEKVLYEVHGFLRAGSRVCHICLCETANYLLTQDMSLLYDYDVWKMLRLASLADGMKIPDDYPEETPATEPQTEEAAIDESAYEFRAFYMNTFTALTGWDSPNGFKASNPQPNTIYVIETGEGCVSSEHTLLPYESLTEEEMSEEMSESLQMLEKSVRKLNMEGMDWIEQQNAAENYLIYTDDPNKATVILVDDRTYFKSGDIYGNDIVEYLTRIKETAYNTVTGETMDWYFESERSFSVISIRPGQKEYYRLFISNNDAYAFYVEIANWLFRKDDVEEE